jgi:hypothetical protein
MLSWRDLGEIWPLMLKVKISSYNNTSAGYAAGSDGGVSRDVAAVVGSWQQQQQHLVLQPEQWEAVVLPLAVASSRAPATAQLQITSEIAAAVGGAGSSGGGGVLVVGCPVAAAALVAVLWAAWSQQQPGGGGGGVGALLGWSCMCNVHQVLNVLPRSVVGLLERSGWEGGAELVVDVLLKMMTVQKKGSGLATVDHHQQKEEEDEVLQGVVRQVLTCGVVEVGRHLLLHSPRWWSTVQGEEALRMMGL